MTDSKELFYDRFADVFDEKMNMYDTQKRVQTIYSEFYKDHNLEGKLLLDAGCGTGWFSAEAKRKRAEVVSLDIGSRLLGKVKEKCHTTLLVADIQQLPFDNHTFEYIVSSEVIEHVLHPERAISEMCRVLQPGGYLALTTPNKRWYFAIWIANSLKLRPYEGYEHWISWPRLIKVLEENDMDVQLARGIHLFPFIHKSFYALLNQFDKLAYSQVGKWMVNIAVLAKKRKH